MKPAQTCVWMDAGAVAFRLCDRGFACEGCPFDAAMRGDPRSVVRDRPTDTPSPPASWSFPADRLYTSGHIWVKLIQGDRVRAGIDACASRLLTHVRRMICAPSRSDLRRGDPLCTLTIDSGELPLGSPASGRVCQWNDALDEHPTLMTAEPYTGGWIADLTLTQPDDLKGLLSAVAAAEQADVDARRFRRQIAFHLLCAEPGTGPCIDGASVNAAMHLLGPHPLVALTRQILH